MTGGEEQTELQTSRRRQGWGSECRRGRTCVVLERLRDDEADDNRGDGDGPARHWDPPEARRTRNVRFGGGVEVGKRGMQGGAMVVRRAGQGEATRDGECKGSLAMCPVARDAGGSGSNGICRRARQARRERVRGAGERVRRRERKKKRVGLEGGQSIGRVL